MPFFDAGDAAIYYEEAGSNHPPLILLHGYALNGLMWELQIPELVRNFRTITVDLRGFGKSSCGPRWSTAAMTEDVLGLIAELNIRGAAILGFSMSGPVAFRVALSRPDRISKLILVSSILPSSGKPAGKAKTEAMSRELELLQKGGIELWAERTGIRNGPLVANMFRRNPNIRGLWDKILMRHNPDYLQTMLRGRIAAEPDGNWRRRLSELNQPVLVIAGAQDSQFIDAAKYLARHLKNSKLEIINGAAHMVNLEEPAAVTGKIIDFLNQAPGRPAGNFGV